MVGMPIARQMRIGAPLFTGLLIRNPKVREWPHQHRQIALTQQFQVHRDIAQAPYEYVLERHDVLTEREHVITTTHDRCGFTDKVDRMLGQERHQFRPVQDNVSTERIDGVNVIGKQIAITVDAPARRRYHFYVRAVVQHIELQAHAVRQQQVVVIKKLDVRTLRETDRPGIIVRFAQRRFIFEIVNRPRAGRPEFFDNVLDAVVAAVIGDDDLDVVMVLSQRTGKCSFKESRFVSGDDNTDQA